MRMLKNIYDRGDLTELQDGAPTMLNPQRLTSIGDLLARDIQREKDGFPRKVRIGRLIKPGRGGKDKIVIVPTTIEEKLIHDTRPQNPEAEPDQSGGSGEGEEGEIIGEESLQGQEGAGAGGPGQGEGA